MKWPQSTSLAGSSLLGPREDLPIFSKKVSLAQCLENTGLHSRTVIARF